MNCRQCATDVIALLTGADILEDTLRFYNIVPMDEVSSEQVEILKNGVIGKLDDIIKRCELPVNSPIHQVREDLFKAITINDATAAVEGLDGKLYNSLKM